MRDGLHRLAVGLIRLYPRAFRASYGLELEEAVGARLAQARVGRWRLWRVFELLAVLGGQALLAWLDQSVRVMRELRAGARSDLRFIGRSLRQSPGYALVVIVVLAVSVAAVSAAAGFVRGTLLHRASYPDPDRVVLVWGSNEVHGQMRDVVSGPNFLDLRAATRTLSGLAAVHQEDGVLQEGDRPAVIDVLEVSVDFLDVLGVAPALGSNFADQQRSSGGAAAVIVSHSFWRDRLGGDPAVLGRTLRLSGVSRTIVGVLPARFEFLLPTTVLVPLAEDQLAAMDRTTHHYWLFGRLAARATVAEAASELSARLSDIALRDPRMNGWSVRVEPAERVSRNAVRPALLALSAAVLLVLLAAAANLATLHGVRALRRGSELFVRHALGASTPLLVRLIALETALLVLAGVTLGLLGANVLIDGLTQVVPARIAIPGSAAVVQAVAAARDAPVWLSGVMAGVMAGVLFAIPALLQVRRLSGRVDRLTGARVRGAPAGSRPLMAAQLTLAMMLLVSAGLLLRSADRLLSVDPGVDPENLLTLYVGHDDGADAPARARYFLEVVRRLDALPGVVRAGAIDYVPFSGEDDFKGLRFEDRPPPLPGQGIREEWRRVSEGYFAAAGIALQRGRSFSQADFDHTPAVAIVNQAFARKHWPGLDPIGRRLRVSDPAYSQLEVVGLVKDVPERGPALAPPPMLFVPLHGNPRDNMALFIRTRTDPLALLDPIRAAVWSVDATQPIDRIAPMRALIDHALAVPQLARTIVGTLAACALALALLGLVCVMNHSLRARRSELSLRLALGASPARLQRDLATEMAPLLVIGLALGSLGGVCAGLGARALLHGISPLDAASITCAALVLLASALLAIALPARTVSRLEPALTLAKGN